MRYDNDPTVEPFGNSGGYSVQQGDSAYQVLPNDAMGWGVYAGENLDLVPVAGGGFAIGFATADDAIAAVKGDQPTSTSTSTDSDDNTDGM